ncbi:MAG: hypothetical protein V3T08_09430 [Gemmatimonadota bacterium]
MSQNSSVLFLIAVLSTGISAGWLIFGVRGRPGDVASGFLMGVLAALMLGQLLARGAKGE